MLLWWMRRRVAFDRLPRERLVVGFEFPGARPPRSWMVLRRRAREASVCLKHPGFDADVAVAGDMAAFYRVWLGREALAAALRRGEVRLEGAPADLRGFARWFTWSPMAEAVRAALPRGRDPAARHAPLH